MKCLLFDLETYGFNFNADAGFIMCGSYKWLGEKKVYTITRKNPGKWTKHFQDDRSICKELKEVMEEADMVVGWNSKSFDWRFLQTRLLKHRLGYLPPVPHEDGLLTARRTLKQRRDLKSLSEFFGFQTKKEKMDLYGVWMRAGAGDPIALKQVIKRCESDVLILEEAYKLLSPLSKVHPNVAVINGVFGGCPLCASKRLHKRGKMHALRHYRDRYQCQDCGRWSTSDPIRIKRKN